MKGSADPPIAIFRTEAELLLKVSRWGSTSAAIFAASFAAGALCAKLAHDDKNACLVPYILLQIPAMACGIAAGVRGSKVWFLLVLISACLTAQAVIALLVE
jgi:hypothetical protein